MEKIDIIKRINSLEGLYKELSAEYQAIVRPYGFGDIPEKQSRLATEKGQHIANVVKLIDELKKEAGIPVEGRKTKSNAKQVSSKDCLSQCVELTGWGDNECDKYVSLVVMDFLLRVDEAYIAQVDEQNDNFWMWVYDMLAPVCLSIINRKEQYPKTARNALLRAFKQSIVCQFNNPTADAMFRKKFNRDGTGGNSGESYIENIIL